MFVGHTDYADYTDLFFLRKTMRVPFSAHAHDSHANQISVLSVASVRQYPRTDFFLNLTRKSLRSASRRVTLATGGTQEITERRIASDSF